MNYCEANLECAQMITVLAKLADPDKKTTSLIAYIDLVCDVVPLLLFPNGIFCVYYFLLIYKGAVFITAITEKLNQRENKGL